MDIDELIGRHPRLYHMAADGSWPSIRDRGLLPTKALIEMCDVPPALEQDLLRARRPQTIELPDRDGNTISIRDQKPLKLHNLRLIGTDIHGWLDLLNSQAFFWVDENRLHRLLSAKAYLPLRHHVLTIDTEELVARHARNVRLSNLNSGATIFPNSPTRGPHTFQRLPQFQWAGRRSSDGSHGPVVEVTVRDGVPDVANVTLDVQRVEDGRWTVVYER